MSVLARDKTDQESDGDEEGGPLICRIMLFELRSHLDDLIIFIDSSFDPEIQLHYSHFRAFRNDYNS
jgi:hypothetical protein